MSRVRRGSICMLAAILPTLMGGCAVDQSGEVALYRQVLDEPAPPPAPPAPGEALTLEMLLWQANQNHESLGLRGESYLQAIIARRRAASAFMPTINLAPSHFRQDPVSGADNDRTDVPVAGRLNVFNGFSDLANYRAAGQDVQRQRALLLDAQASLLLDVAVAYYRVLRAERSVEVLRSSLSVQEERVREIRARGRAGLARPLDVWQTEAQASATRVSLLEARNDVVKSRLALSLLSGVEIGQTPLVDDATVPPDLPHVQALLEAAEQQRQDLAAARAAVEAARLDVDAAIGRYYPSVTLNVNYFLSRQSNPTESDWNAILSANLPLFSAGTIHADVRAAWSALRQAQLAESLTRRTIQQQVRTAVENLASSAQRIAELEVQVAAAQQSLRQAEESYRVGLGTNLERVVAQNSLLAAQLQLSSARFDRRMFYLELLRVTGGLTLRLPPQTAAAPAADPTTGPAAP
jgi:outer membrane protein TolC